jgi:hypothetical protein
MEAPGCRDGVVGLKGQSCTEHCAGGGCFVLWLVRQTGEAAKSGWVNDQRSTTTAVASSVESSSTINAVPGGVVSLWISRESRVSLNE